MASVEPAVAWSEMAVAQPASFAVEVPAGALPGMMMQVSAPNGVTLQVAVPEGMTEGQIFQVAIPPVQMATVSPGTNEAEQDSGSPPHPHHGRRPPTAAEARCVMGFWGVVFSVMCLVFLIVGLPAILSSDE